MNASHFSLLATGPFGDGANNKKQQQTRGGALSYDRMISNHTGRPKKIKNGRTYTPKTQPARAQNSQSWDWACLNCEKTGISPAKAKMALSYTYTYVPRAP